VSCFLEEPSPARTHADGHGPHPGAIALAIAGDAAALRLCLDRTVAPRRERPVEVAPAPIFRALSKQSPPQPGAAALPSQKRLRFHR
jgi:hypothetical protein